MDFASREFLNNHVHTILQFYEPIVLDPEGGFFQNFKDDGTVFDHKSRHLVSSTRFVFLRGILSARPRRPLSFLGSARPYLPRTVA